MIDKHLAWLNANIDFLDEKSKNNGDRSMHDRRRSRYQRDILIKAREDYMKHKEVKA